MSRLSWLPIVFSFLVLVVAGCSDSNRPAEGPPALSFEEEHVQLGKLYGAVPGFEAGETIVPVVFKVTNTSDEAVRIREINSGCGCTKAEDTPEVIEPGAEKQLEFRFNPDTKRGTSTTNIRVVAEENGVREYQIAFSADVIPMLYWDTLVEDMGEINVGQEKSFRYPLYSLLDEGLGEIDVWTYDERLSARDTGDEEPFKLEDGDEGTIRWFEVVIPPDLPVGQFSSEVVLRTDGEGKRFPPLTVKGEIVSDVGFEPYRVYANMQPGGIQQVPVVLKSKSGSPFDIVSVHLTEKLPVKVDQEEGDNPGEQKLVFTFSPTAESGGSMAKANVDVKTGESDRPIRLQIPVMMIVRKDG